MTVTTPNTASEPAITHRRAAMSPTRKAALIAGVAYVATVVLTQNNRGN